MGMKRVESVPEMDHPLMGMKRGESVPEMLELKSPSFHPTASAILQLKAMFIPNIQINS